MRFALLLLLLLSQMGHTGSIYQCKNENGSMSFQDRPCKGETVKVNELKSNFDNGQFREEMIKTLAKMTGKSESDLQDPNIRKVAEILAATDAAKSYAFTKIYEISARYCSGSVERELAEYKKRAADIIGIGEYFYTNGIQGQVDGENIRKTGKELTDGLNEMLARLENEHKTASKSELERKCRDASKALRSLTALYSG